MANDLHPRVLAMILTERVSYDPQSHKATLHGVIGSIPSPSLPCVLDALCVYGQIDGFIGAREIFLHIIFDGKVLWTGNVLVTGHTENEPSAFIFSVKDIQFNQFGWYTFQIVHYGEIIGEREILVHIPFEMVG